MKGENPTIINDVNIPGTITLPVRLKYDSNIHINPSNKIVIAITKTSLLILTAIPLNTEVYSNPKNASTETPAASAVNVPIVFPFLFALEYYIKRLSFLI